MILMISPESKKHYLFLIKRYLLSVGALYASPFEAVIHERKAGKIFSFADHIKGLVYALLTNQTKWYRIEPHLKEIDKLFFYYQSTKIKETPPQYFYNGLLALKCGNISTKAQMHSLDDNIAVFERIEKKYGSLDKFVTSAPPQEIVERLSKAGSAYKLRMIGEALAWEYLRNVGIDGAKPDTHLRRFLGSDRMGNGQNSPANPDEVTSQITKLSKETGLSKAEIDNLIWSFCADGYGAICTATPHCTQCVIRQYCNHEHN